MLWELVHVLSALEDRMEMKFPDLECRFFLFLCVCKLFKYVLLIMLLQLSHFFLSFIPLHPASLLLPVFPAPPLSSCPWVIYVSSLASPFPILFLTSSCLFCTYYLCFLFPVPFPPFSTPHSPLITIHVISISVILFLF